MWNIFLLSSMFVFTYCKLQPPLETELIKSSAKCISSVVQKYFIKRSTVSVFTTGIYTYTSVLNEVYQAENYDKKSFNFTNFKVNFLDVGKRYSIILGRDLNDFILPTQLDNLALWNAKSLIIFYIFNNSEYLLQEFVDTIWTYYIINAIVMMPSLQNEELLNIYSLFPYSGQNYGKSVTSVWVNSCTHGILQTTTKLFSNKIPLNLQGCTVRVRILIWPPFTFIPEDGKIIDDVPLNFTDGVEIQMIKTIASFANFTIEFSSSTVPNDWGMVTPEGNITGALAILREKVVDIGLGAYGVTVGRIMYFDYTAPHMQETLTWCVPKAQEARHWKKLLAPFETQAWIAMLVTYLFISISVWMLCYISPKDISAYVHINNTFKYLFTTFLGQNAHAMPNKLSGRILFLFWLFFGLQFVVAYQAKLIGVLLKPLYEQQISTLDEILLSGMEYQILPTYKRFFVDIDDWRVAKILQEWTSCYDSDACLRRVATERAYAFCTSRIHFDFEALKYRNSEGESLVFCTDYTPEPLTIYMTKGYPLRDRIESLMCRIRDTGLLDKWNQSIKWIWLYKYRNTLPKSKKEQKLRLVHMTGAFFVLFLGLTTALGIFIIELMYAKLMRILK